MKTTVGDIDLELWTKVSTLQAQMDCGEVFRMDPTGTGEGGESIYGHSFKV